MNPEVVRPEVRKIAWTLWAGIGLLLATLLLAYLLAQVRYRRSLGPPLRVLGQVADFALTNQNAQPFTLDNLKGHVWVGDIIFTTCPVQCLKMTRQMKQIQDALGPQNSARLVSLTTYPAYDTPDILLTYANRQGADPARWTFLTGPKPEIQKLAVGSLKLTAVDKPAADRESPNDLFIHSTIFVLVDKHARLRGVFDTMGEGVHPKDVTAQILAAIKRLNRES
jgi:protein SCO1/2